MTLAEVDELDDDTRARFWALSLIDDWGNDGTADICAAVHNSLMILASKLGGEVNKKDFRKAEDYQRKFGWEIPKTKRQSGADQFNIIKRALRL